MGGSVARAEACPRLKVPKWEAGIALPSGSASRPMFVDNFSSLPKFIEDV